MLTCISCGEACEGGHHDGDTIVFVCPSCSGYRLSETAFSLLESGILEPPYPADFRQLIRTKRGDSGEYPVITRRDLEA